MRKLFLILMTLMVCSWSLMAQTRTYHGTVVDASNGEPLVGATIMPVGGGQGAAADLDGNFTVTVPSNVKKANVSYVGYTTQTVPLTEGMIVRLASSSTSLDDVVVVAYGTTTKEALTGSVAVVGSKDIEDRPITTVTAALEGNAPGVQVNNSTGTPGSAPAIRIRGFNSINGSSTPLYVVDGVPFEGSINDLNPADIESMSVLKDAASCALYGNRGANGVILITTKRAKNVGKVDVTIQIRQGMYNRGLPFYDRLDANEWMQTSFWSLVNGDVTNDLMYGREDDVEGSRARWINAWRGTKFIETFAQNNIYGVADDALFDENGTFIGGNPLPGYTDLDWWNAVSRSGYRQEYNLNASGATENYNIFASIGYLKENGYTLGTDFERFAGRMNANFQPVKYLRFGINLAATSQQSETGNVDADNLDAINNPFSTQFNAPIYPYYQHYTDPETLPEGKQLGDIITDDYGQPLWNTAGYLSGTNVAWEMRCNKHSYNKTMIDANAYATAVLPYGFDLTVRGQMLRSKINGMEYLNNIVGSQAGSGMIQNTYDENRSHTFMQTLEWSHDYGANHVEVLLDHENYTVRSTEDYLQKANQILSDRIFLDNFSTLQYGMSSMAELHTESYLGRIRYNYDQKYFGEASIRRDGSSKFSKDHRWGNFWSVGGSWVISREKFMQNLSWMNYLKLRAAYGSVGNDGSAGTYSAYSLYGWNIYNGVSNMSPGQLGVNNLKWESTSTLDAALEGSLFNSRLDFSVGFFDKRNSDLLFRFVLPLSFGTLGSGSNPAIWQNVGTMRNYGWEISLGYDIIRNKDLYWNVHADATFLKNRITKLPGGHDLPAQNLFIGKSLYEHRNVEWAGVDMLTGQSMYLIDPNSPDFIEYDEDGKEVFQEKYFQQFVEGAMEDAEKGYSVFIERDGKYYTSNTSFASSKLCGTALPTVYGSVSTALSWKGINLSLLFTYSLGGKTYDSSYQQLMQASTLASALHRDVLKSWTAAPEGMTEDSPNRMNKDAIPQLNSTLSVYNNSSSSRFLTSSSYLTLKNINLSYDLPLKWVSAMQLQKINIGCSIDNLFIVAARKGMNPQYGFGGGQGAFYVPARVFSFQLDARF